MSRPSRLVSLLFVGLLLVTGGTVVAATVDQPLQGSNQLDNDSTQLVAVSNSSNYLSIDTEDIRREQYQSTSLDVAGAVQADAVRLQGSHKERMIQQRLEAGSDKRAIRLSVLRELEQNALSLERQKRQLYRQYSEGEIDTAQLFREVVRLGVAANQYRDIATSLQGTAGDDSLNRQYLNLDGEPALLPSVMVSQIESALSTGGTSQTYVQAGNESLLLATIAGDSFFREAMVFGEYDREGSQQFGADGGQEVEDAFSRAEQLYPWTVDDATDPELRGFGNTSVYRLTANHGHGSLQAYIDGTTRNTFYEIHEKEPFSVPVTDFTQTTNDGLRLDVQLTDPTGPMLIEVIETDDLIYNNITVSVGDEVVKTLDSGGDFFTIQPTGSFEVTAETDTGQKVSVAIFPD